MISSVPITWDPWCGILKRLMLLHFGKSNPFARLKMYCRANDENNNNYLLQNSFIE